MSEIPLDIRKYICSIWMAENLMTYLYIDEHGNLISWGGYPQHYGLINLRIGKPAIEQLSFLDGMLTIPDTQVLPFVCIGEERSAHVHIVPVDMGTYVLMFDATAECDREQKMQQQLNEISILCYRQSQLLQKLETAR